MLALLRGWKRQCGGERVIRLALDPAAVTDLRIVAVLDAMPVLTVRTSKPNIVTAARYVVVAFAYVMARQFKCARPIANANAGRTIPTRQVKGGLATGNHVRLVQFTATGVAQLLIVRRGSVSSGKRFVRAWLVAAVED